MSTKHGSLPVALTIAGSDSGGGAGIQADLKTFQAFGVFGTSAVTALTVQNTRGVSAVHAVPLEIVRGQIDAVAEDLHPAACKSGMLATRELVDAVAAAIRAHGLPHYVLDPVMVATSGDRLLDEDAQRAILLELVPLATLVTPNLDEASILAGFEVREPAAMRRAAALLIDAGAGAALIKGGHLGGHEVVDVFHDGDTVHEFRQPRLDSTSTHGTGCTLSAAIAAGLASGDELRHAVEQALDYVHRAIAAAPGLGRGHGPLNHLVPARPGAGRSPTSG
jgi:hydroxymethylpyrimidine kinase/phosphomethylpyrimidine kinase